MPTCPRCGGDVAEGVLRCEHCGHLLSAPPVAAPAPAPGAPRLIAGLGCGMLTVILVLISVVVVFGLLLGGLVGAAGARLW
jgi:hypothetical protein